MENFGEKNEDLNKKIEAMKEIIKIASPYLKKGKVDPHIADEIWGKNIGDTEDGYRTETYFGYENRDPSGNEDVNGSPKIVRNLIGPLGLVERQELQIPETQEGSEKLNDAIYKIMQAELKTIRGSDKTNYFAIMGLRQAINLSRYAFNQLSSPLNEQEKENFESISKTIIPEDKYSDWLEAAYKEGNDIEDFYTVLDIIKVYAARPQYFEELCKSAYGETQKINLAMLLLKFGPIELNNNGIETDLPLGIRGFIKLTADIKDQIPLEAENLIEKIKKRVNLLYADNLTKTEQMFLETAKKVNGSEKGEDRSQEGYTFLNTQNHAYDATEEDIGGAQKQIREHTKDGNEQIK